MRLLSPFLSVAGESLFLGERRGVSPPCIVYVKHGGLTPRRSPKNNDSPAWRAYVPDLPGCVAAAKTLAEVKEGPAIQYLERLNRIENPETMS